MNEEHQNASTFAWSERQQRPGIADTYALGGLVSLRSCSPERLKAFSVTFPNPGATNGQTLGTAQSRKSAARRVARRLAMKRRILEQLNIERVASGRRIPR
jgi:hypothetical protein